MPPKLLLIDDDREYTGLLRRVLEQHGLVVTVCDDGRRGVEAALTHSVDLVLLDVTMPDIDGFSVLHRVCRDTNIPVIMLTSRIASADRVYGLDSGADDYICKPCEPAELLSRIRAVLRRSQQTNALPPAFIVGAHRFSPTTHQLTLDGHAVHLTSLEGELLAMLLQAHGKPVTREAIARLLQDRALDAFDRSLDVHVSRLRAKLGPDGSLIQTQRGKGYLLPSATPGEL